MERGDSAMSKDITPEFKKQHKSHEYEIADERYIDKGNLTSRECGRLVKGMVEEYERRFK
jgi:Small, acid-soluble spore proteins, alpha/beta type.